MKLKCPICGAEFEVSDADIAALMGQRGGSQTSARKAASSAANGKKGGRPRKIKPIPDKAKPQD